MRDEPNYAEWTFFILGTIAGGIGATALIIGTGVVHWFLNS